RRRRGEPWCRSCGGSEGATLPTTASTLRAVLRRGRPGAGGVAWTSIAWRTVLARGKAPRGAASANGSRCASRRGRTGESSGLILARRTRVISTGAPELVEQRSGTSLVGTILAGRYVLGPV